MQLRILSIHTHKTLLMVSSVFAAVSALILVMPIMFMVILIPLADGQRQILDIVATILVLGVVIPLINFILAYMALWSICWLYHKLAGKSDGIVVPVDQQDL